MASTDVKYISFSHVFIRMDTMAIILYKWQLEKSIEAWQMVYDEIYLHESSNQN